MSLQVVRDLFIRATGRSDLATLNGDDLGPGGSANFFINAGQRMLDRMIRIPQFYRSYRTTLKQGRAIVSLKFCKAVKEVWISDADGRHPMLVKQSLTELRERYNKDVSSLELGCPLYYAIASGGMSPEQEALTEDTYRKVFLNDYSDLVWGDACCCPGEVYCIEDLKALILMPPAKHDYTVTVFGLFYSRELVENDDCTYWTDKEPNILVMAARYQLECFLRNTEGSNDDLLSIQRALDGIRYTVIEEELAGWKGIYPDV